MKFLHDERPMVRASVLSVITRVTRDRARCTQAARSTAGIQQAGLWKATFGMTVAFWDRLHRCG